MRSRDALAMADDRFEVRLAQESSAIRQEIATVRAEMATRKELEAVRAEMATRTEVEAVRTEIGTVRAEMATRAETDALRNEMATLRQDLNAGFAKLERQVSESRVEMIKWSFLFWTGQCFVILGFLLVFLRSR
jgi:hypothetical protein